MLIALGGLKIALLMGNRLKVRCEQRLVIAALTPDAGCALPGGQPAAAAKSRETFSCPAGIRLHP